MVKNGEEIIRVVDEAMPENTMLRTHENRSTILAAIAGDIAGSRFERSVWQGESFDVATCVAASETSAGQGCIGKRAIDFELLHTDSFVTDDSLMMLAIVDWLDHGGDLRSVLRKHFRAATHHELFGKYFRAWAMRDDDSSCGSVGNGAAMRVAPIALVADSLASVRTLARQTAIVTHEVEHAIVGAEAIASAVYLALTTKSKDAIREYVSGEFGYDLAIDIDTLRDANTFSSDCRVTVPQAIVAALTSNSVEETIRRAISLGGDTDTVACMAAAIAGSLWGLDCTIENHVLRVLDSQVP